MRSTKLRFCSLFAILALVLAACSGGGGSSEEPAGSEPAGSEPASSEAASGEVVEIRWFCCLGAGDNAETQVPTEEAVVAAFNESHDDIELVLEVVDYDSAYDVAGGPDRGRECPRYPRAGRRHRSGGVRGSVARPDRRSSSRPVTI